MKGLIFISFLFFSQNVFSLARTASVTGNWSNTATWGGASVPVAGDDVTIGAGIDVTVDVNSACATIIMANTTKTITISAGISLTVSGAITMTSTSSGITNTIAVGSGSLIAGSVSLTCGGSNTRHAGITCSTGSVTINGSVTCANSGGSYDTFFTFTGAGTLNVHGDFDYQTASTTDLAVCKYTASTGTLILVYWRSLANGNWNATSTWESSFDSGSTWGSTHTLTPSSLHGVITITHSVTVTANVSTDQIIINSGGILTVNTAVTLTISDGSGTDFTVNTGGELVNSVSASAAATITTTGTISFAGTSTYTHAGTGGVIPTATWAAGSTCSITGTTGTAPTNIFGQSFGHFIWNASGSNCTLTSSLGVTLTVQGNYTHSSGVVLINANTSSITTNYVNITGNLLIDGGTLKFTTGDASGGIINVNVTGDFTISNAATLDMMPTVNQGLTCVLTVNGNFTQSGTSILQSTSSADMASIVFNGTSTYTKSGGTYTNSYINVTVNSGAILTLATDFPIATSRTFTESGTLIFGTGSTDQTNSFNVTGAGTFTLTNASTTTLKITSTAGITAAVGTATGNVLVTGTRTLTSAVLATFHYIGTSVQTTGTGLPSTVGNLIFNNAAGVTLTAGVIISDAGTLTLTAGYHDLSTFILQLGTTAATTLTYTAGGLYSSTDNGTFKRYIPTGAVTSTSGNYYGLFPFKKSAALLNYFEMNSTSNVTTAGFISAVPKFASTILNVTDYSDGNGTVTHVKSGKAVDVALTTIAGGIFDLKLSSGTFAGGTLTDYTLVTYTAPGVVASYQGTFSASTGNSTLPVLNRTGIATADLANGWVVGTYNQGVTTLPIELISFVGEKSGVDNQLQWSSAMEKNSDLFTIEKTIDGTHFEVVGSQSGAGNSTQTSNYFLTDYNVRPVVNYYRLKQTDFDGKSIFSDLISIDNSGGKRKEVVKMINILGQEVNEMYRGIVIIYYSNGSSTKVIH